MIVKYWCNTHRLPAPLEGWDTYLDGSELRRCHGSRGKGRIMIPCYVVDCEEVGIEIDFEEDPEEAVQREELIKRWQETAQERAEGKRLYLQALKAKEDTLRKEQEEWEEKWARQK